MDMILNERKKSNADKMQDIYDYPQSLHFARHTTRKMEAVQNQHQQAVVAGASSKRADDADEYTFMSAAGTLTGQQSMNVAALQANR